MTRYYLVVGSFAVALGTLAGCSGGPPPSEPVTEEQADENADSMIDEMMQAEGVEGSGPGNPSASTPSP